MPSRSSRQDTPRNPSEGVMSDKHDSMQAVAVQTKDPLPKKIFDDLIKEFLERLVSEESMTEFQLEFHRRFMELLEKEKAE
jgi:hypothetical protein